MRVLITGATGLIGREIVKFCHAKGIKVSYLTTSKPKIIQQENYSGFYWNPKSKEIDKNCFENVDGVIHLVGATISKRWTSSYKKIIISSRTETTKLLISALKTVNHTVKQIVSASAIGIYPNSLANYYNESYSEISTSFLGQVVSAWEESVNEFTQLNINVSKIRIGLVLSNKGGALQEIIKPIKFGLGSSFGHGKQWQSWIHINDLAKMFLYVFENKLDGIYNGVAPNPVSNTELIKTTANILKRPLFMPNTPKLFMKLILGEMSSLLFESQRVSSQKIKDKGFFFKYDTLEPALLELLKD